MTDVKFLPHPPESQVVSLWNTLLESGAGLVTDTGEPLSLQYPGRLNDDHGADICGAVIITRHGKRCGDIEFHVLASDWYNHGHHRDQAYRKVILHVVLWNDRPPILNPEDELPTISLYHYLTDSVKQSLRLSEPAAAVRIPCDQAAIHNPEKTAAMLEAAGEARFQEKAVRFQQRLVHGNAGQVLYAGIMEALGYSKNKIPFVELAERMPLELLESSGRRKVPDAACLAGQQALLMGTAGLLPSQRPDSPEDGDDDYADVIEKAWHTADRAGIMSLKSWDLYKVRPVNSPVRRLVAMSYLLQRYREKGLYNSLMEAFKNVPADKGKLLINGILVASDGYWRDHYDIGMPSPVSLTGLIGADRAAEIAVNVLLPFMHALGCRLKNITMREKARELYRSLPAGNSNSIERCMAERLGLRNNVAGTACRRQGLIHIYRNYCTRGSCNECPFNVSS